MEPEHRWDLDAVASMKGLLARKAALISERAFNVALGSGSNTVFAGAGRVHNPCRRAASAGLNRAGLLT